MWAPAKTKKDRKQQIKELLLTNDRAVARGVVAIYKRQTDVEQDQMSTTDTNGVGFNGLDAEIMSSFAQRLLRGVLLSDKQMACARKLIVKYAGQLMDIADQRNVVAA
jgi:hypothetical protein